MNIEQVNGLWYAVVRIPKDLRSVLGLKFRQSLKTHVRSEAQLRALPLIARWKQEIKKARGQFAPDTDEALVWKRDLQHATVGDEHTHGTHEIIVDALAERAEVISAKQGSEKAAEFYRVAMGQWTPLQPLYVEWKDQLSLGKKTMDQMSRDVARLVEHFKAVEAITPKAVKLWADELVLAGATHSSLDRILKSCRSLWNYLRKTSVIELDRLDPFAGIISLVASKVERNRQGRVAWEPTDLAKIYQAALDKGDQPLADIIALGAYTGARIDELGSIKVVDVTRRGSLMITDSKTKAGIREIPIHPELIPVIERLTNDATTDYLIPADADNQYGQRGDVLGKRFGRLKKSMGFAAGAQVFHSIRKTLITLMENAGVSEGVAADIVGHEKQTMTYGLYSMGSELEIKREALSKARYPAPLVGIK
ncbi:MAG: tyrosine-type recombinase/integrase [Telluria sp.]